VDPNEALRQLRAKLTELDESPDLDLANLTMLASEARELFEGLDGWLHKGGFLPRHWAHARTRVIDYDAPLPEWS
jgi:hypothetical protein